MSGLSSLDYINFVYIANQDNYFTTPSYWYWTMTPFVTAGGNAQEGVEQQQVHFLLDRKEDMNLKSKEPSETLFTRQRKSG